MPLRIKNIYPIKIHFLTVRYTTCIFLSFSQLLALHSTSITKSHTHISNSSIQTRPVNGFLPVLPLPLILPTPMFHTLVSWSMAMHPFKTAIPNSNTIQHGTQVNPFGLQWCLQVLPFIWTIIHLQGSDTPLCHIKKLGHLLKPCHHHKDQVCIEKLFHFKKCLYIHWRILHLMQFYF